MFPLHLLRRFPTARCVRSIRWTASNALDDQLIITNSCVKKLKQLQQKSADRYFTYKYNLITQFTYLFNNLSALYLRISVESGGCSGFQYVFLVENKVISQEEDLVYDKDGNYIPLIHSLTYSLASLRMSCGSR